jgi:hypothetical protein
VGAYVAAIAVLALVLAWAALAARPFGAAAPEDPRLVALERRERALTARAAAVQRVVPAPDVPLIAAPPVTATRSS